MRSKKMLAKELAEMREELFVSKNTIADLQRTILLLQKDADRWKKQLEEAKDRNSKLLDEEIGLRLTLREMLISEGVYKPKVIAEVWNIEDITVKVTENDPCPGDLIDPATVEIGYTVGRERYYSDIMFPKPNITVAEVTKAVNTLLLEMTNKLREIYKTVYVTPEES